MTTRRSVIHASGHATSADLLRLARAINASRENAARYNASSPEDTQDGSVAYARFANPQPTRYRNGLLPD